MIYICLSPSNACSPEFPKGADCILSRLQMANPSQSTNNRSVSECLSYPAKRTQTVTLRITQSSTLLPYPSSYLGHICVSTYTWQWFRYLLDSVGSKGLPASRCFANNAFITLSTKEFHIFNAPCCRHRCYQCYFDTFWLRIAYRHCKVSCTRRSCEMYLPLSLFQQYDTSYSFGVNSADG